MKSAVPCVLALWWSIGGKCARLDEDEASSVIAQDVKEAAEKCSGEVFISSQNKQQLEDREGKVDKLNGEKLSWQVWNIEKAEASGHILLKSHRDKYLEDREGKLGLSEDHYAYQEWSITQVPETQMVFLQGHFKNKLTHGGEDVELSANSDDASQYWTITKKGGKVVCTSTTTTTTTTKAACKDVPGWINSESTGFDCAHYANEWCENGKYTENNEWTLGRGWNFPEVNCCVCGRAAWLACEDETDWSNTEGHTCSSFGTSYCENGKAREGQEWALGSTWGYPENKCCACGKAS